MCSALLIVLPRWYLSPLGRRITPWYLASVVTLGLGVLLLVGCASDSLKPPPIDEHDLYWQLALNHHAVMLSTAPTYDTLTLAATPQNMHGEALPGFPAPTYQSRDVATVRISADGVLQAVAANSQPVWVLATLTASNARHVDSTLVRVVDLATPPVLASFSIHPLPPDSAKTYGGTNVILISDLLLPHRMLPTRAADASGTPFDSLVPGGIPVFFHSSDSTIAQVDRVTGVIKGQIPGTVTLDASTTVFGVSKTDTLPYRVSWPLVNGVNVTPTGVSPSEITITAGGMVLWQRNEDTTTTDITFNNADVLNIAVANTSPTAHIITIFGLTFDDLCAFMQSDCVSAGNISLGPSSVGAWRAFPVAGTYEYRSMRYGFAGRIIVVDER